MDAVFCVDRVGLKHFAVSATSLAIHRPPLVKRAFLLSVDVQEKDVSRFFDFLEKSYGLECELVRIPSEKFAGFPVHGHVTVGAYFRLLMGEVLPPSVSHVLYLDTDIAVHQPLESHLRKATEALDASGYPVAAVAENTVLTRHLHRAGLISGPYLQSGVMLIDLAKWREAFSLEYFKNIQTQYGEKIVWWDQDILNIALKERWLELPQIWNGTPGNRTSATLIYHYAGNQKPWRFRGEADDKDIYNHYRKQTMVLRPLATDPKTVINYFARPLKNAKKAITKRLKAISKRARSNRLLSL